MTACPARRGFTLVELLVVIAIIGVLVGLLLPAIQAAREAARRAQCKSNIKQMVLGLQNYETARKTLPPGCEHDNPAWPASSNTNLGNWSWSALILPYVEQTAVYNQIGVAKTDLAHALDIPSNLTAMQASLGVYRCPSETGPLTNDERTIGRSNGDEFPLATSTYVGVNSSDELQRVSPNTLSDPFPNGIFRNHLGTKLKEISDGLSNTLCVGERAWETTLPGTQGLVLGRAGVVYGVRGVRHASEEGLADSLGCGKYRMNSSALPDPKFARRGFSSQHPGGAHFGLGDGSARFISDTIECDFGPDDIALNPADVDSPWEALLGKDDGVVVGDF